MSFQLEHMIMQRGAQSAVNALQASYEADLDTLEVKLAAAEKRAAEAERKAKELAFALLIAEAHGEAMLAQAKELATRHPNDPILALTGRIDSKGRKEKIIHRDVYDVVFDHYLKGKGVQNPAKYRS